MATAHVLGKIITAMTFFCVYDKHKLGNKLLCYFSSRNVVPTLFVRNCYRSRGLRLNASNICASLTPLSHWPNNNEHVRCLARKRCPFIRGRPLSSKLKNRQFLQFTRIGGSPIMLMRYNFTGSEPNERTQLNAPFSSARVDARRAMPNPSYRVPSTKHRIVLRKAPNILLVSFGMF